MSHFSNTYKELVRQDEVLTSCSQLGVFFLVALFIYFPMLMRFGYHWDETLDFTGAAWETYVANGRWMQAFVRWVLGSGSRAWTPGLLGLLLLSTALVVQLRVLRLGGKEGLLYGLLHITLFQYAYIMQYSFMTDVVALGLLLASLAFRAIVHSPKLYSRILVPVIYITLSLGIYQTIALYFATLFIVWVILESIRQKLSMKQVWSLGVTMAVVCCCSLMVWFALKTVTCMWMDREVVDAYGHGQASMMNSRGWFTMPLNSKVAHVVHYLFAMVRSCVVPQVAGEWMYSTTIVPCLIIMFRVSMGKMGIGRKLMVIASVPCLWLAPFAMYLVMGNIWPCGIHTRLSEPLAFAALWVIALNGWQVFPVCRARTACVKWLPLALVAMLVLRSSAYVADIAKTERANFESRVFNHKMMELDAFRVAEEAGLAPGTCRYVYFSAGGDYEKDGSVDFSSSYPAFRRLPSARRADYIRHQDILEDMPIWPRKGSVRVNKGEVVIKAPYVAVF